MDGIAHCGNEEHGQTNRKRPHKVKRDNETSKTGRNEREWEAARRGNKQMQEKIKD